jgi:peptide-methionine (S)-S-oxide reductase
VVSFTKLRTTHLVAVALGVTCSLAVALARNGAPGAPVKTLVPDPAVDTPLSASAGTETMVVAGGCFWGVQAVFQHVRGVVSATSGYAGGTAKTAQYEIVSSGRTGHAAAAKVTNDPPRISHGQLLKVFTVARSHAAQRQGPDVGPTADRCSLRGNSAGAKAYIEQLDAAKIFRKKIVTEVTALPKFYDAESYHQDYFFQHPLQPYILINDKPKVEALKKQFPDLFVEHK